MAHSPKLYTLNQIKQCLTEDTFQTIIQEIANGFALLSKNQVALAPVIHLGPFSSTTTTNQLDDACIKSGFIQSQEHFVIKIATGGFKSNFSLPTPLPTADGLMVVFSQTTGMCEGLLLDQGYLTDLRTAAAGAVAAQLLAPKDIKHIGVIGTGIQARFQLKLLKQVCSCRSVVLFGRNQSRTALCQKDIEEMGFTVEIVPNIQTLASKCHLIITTTSSTLPLLMSDWVLSGTHITAVGADGLGKQELDPVLVQRANRIVCDEISQCISFGEVSHAIKLDLINVEQVEALGDVVRQGRTKRKKDDITIFDSTGVAVQDVVIASMAMKLLNGVRSKM